MHTGGSSPAGRPTASAPPTGTITLAFTDIEGSTVRWERDPTAMKAALRRHDVLVRAAIVAHDGHVFKTIGDAFCAAFARPEDAVAAMVEAQRALAAADFSAVDGIRVRAALHVGTADERDGDYFGPTVNRVARLLATAHGGQVLVSGAMTEIVRELLPAGVVLRDLGEHRLKDLARPERVAQLVIRELVDVATPLRSLDARRNNLPRELTSFVGREHEIAELASLLERHALVTLVGSGGIGKTRTSLQVAAHASDAFPDGVWFVELAPLASGDYVASTVAQTANVMLGAGEPIATLVRALATKRVLLVLDNCEHVVAGAAQVAVAIVHGAPNVKILASSRQALGVRGEEVYRLAPLDVPAANASSSAAAVRTSPAVALFVERARSVDMRFVLTDDNVEAVADICRRLDGIALAIELAAVRIRILTPRQLRDRLDGRFRVLTGGSRDALPRQQTLRALIDWSFDLLDDRERTVFQRLATFANGFTLEAAFAVAGGDALDEFDVIDAVASLVDKSLVLVEMAGDRPRYRLFESTRAYAAEKRDATGEREACERRRLTFFIDRMRAAEAADDERWHRIDVPAMFATELEDIRAALDFAFAGTDDVALGAALLATLKGVWQSVGLDSEGIARTRAALERPIADERIVLDLETTNSFFEQNIGRKERALEVARRALARARRLGDRALLVRPLLRVAETAPLQGMYDEAVAVVRELDAFGQLEPPHERIRLLARAYLRGGLGDHAGAFDDFVAIRERERAEGTATSTWPQTLNIAETAHRLGRTHVAIAELRSLLRDFAGNETDAIRWHTKINLAGYSAAVADPDAVAVARDVLRELAPSADAVAFAGIALEHLALALARAGDLDRAVALEGYASAVYRTEGFAREYTEVANYEALMPLLRRRFDESELARRLEAGAALRRDVALALALDR